MTTVIFGRIEQRLVFLKGSPALFHSPPIHCPPLNVLSPGWPRHTAVSSVASTAVGWIQPQLSILQFLVTHSRELGVGGWCMENRDKGYLHLPGTTGYQRGWQDSVLTWNSPEKVPILRLPEEQIPFWLMHNLKEQIWGLFLEQLGSLCWLGDFTLERAAASNFQ